MDYKATVIARSPPPPTLTKEEQDRLDAKLATAQAFYVEKYGGTPSFPSRCE
jgi:hypothetical protein